MRPISHFLFFLSLFFSLNNLFSSSNEHIEAKSKVDTINANDLIDKIDKGHFYSTFSYISDNVNYFIRCNIINNHFVIGSFKIDIKNEKIFNSPIRFNNTVFNDNFLIDNCYINNYFLIDSCLFNKAFGISNTNFKNICGISNSKFLGDVNFNNVTFSEDMVLERDSLKNATFFNKVVFNKRVGFQYSVFGARSRFYFIEINRSVRFDSTYFKEEAIFKTIYFKDYSIFDYATFKNVSFQNTDFFGKLDFNYINIDNAFFGGVRFYNICYFRNNSMLKTLELDDCIFDKTVDFKDTYFPDSIIINNIHFGRMLVNWNQLINKIQPNMKDTLHFEDYSRIYIPFINNFKNIGQYEDEDDCYYKLKNIEKDFSLKSINSNPKTWFRPFFLILFKITCGYGVRPYNVLKCSIFIILFFTFLYYPLGPILERKKDKYLDYTFNYDFRTKLQRFYDAFYFSVSKFTTVGYGDWYPSQEFFMICNFKIIRFRSIAILEGFIGWFLMALFIISLTIKYIR
ncbi:MAG TPA: potassium channel family protein [archaeon]|nr:potassium channel family protein [archaeon]